MKHKILIWQAILLAIVLTGVYFAYPKASLDVEGDFIRVKSINANLIALSESPDFSNVKYVEMEDMKNVSFKLAPGKYYWRASNNMIEGLQNEFVVKSEVGMGIERGENESELVNMGNVKINVSRTESGIMVGNIVLELEETERISDEENTSYIGRQK